MEDYRLTLNVVSWLCAIFSTFFVAARMYTRARISSSIPGADDWFMLVAWISSIACNCLVSVGTTYGFGQHIRAIPNPQHQSLAAMYVLMAPQPALATAFFVKTSIVLGFLRIMGRTATAWSKIVCLVPIAILLCAQLVAFCIMIFYCWPVQKAWNPLIAGTCLDPRILDIAGRSVSAYNVAVDVFCASMPYFLIRKLNIPRKDKRNLIILMGGGIFGAFATIMKIVAMSTISDVADITYAWSEITIWYLVEIHVLMIAGSMPALRPFWRVVVGRYITFKSSSNHNGYPMGIKKASGDDSVTLNTIGGTQRHREVPGPYSVAMHEDNSEGDIQQSGRGDKKSADSESVEMILSNKFGENRSEVKGNDKPSDAESTDWITVTTEVHQTIR